MARIVILFAVIIFPVLVVGSVTADNSRPSTTFDGDDEIGVAVADTSDTQEASGSQRGGSGGRPSSSGSEPSWSKPLPSCYSGNDTQVVFSLEAP
ncbi:hypothetical protein ACHAXN_009716, partial [Cyclotella atomus]